MRSITTNISMPKGLYDQAKARVKKYHYNSVSELIRDALRWWMNDNLTRNGFTPEFEEEVLKAEKEADAGKVVEWNGKGSFVDFVLKHPVLKNAKNKVRRKISRKVETNNQRRSRFDGRNREQVAMV